MCARRPRRRKRRQPEASPALAGYVVANVRRFEPGHRPQRFAEGGVVPIVEAPSVGQFLGEFCSHVYILAYLPPPWHPEVDGHSIIDERYHVKKDGGQNDGFVTFFNCFVLNHFDSEGYTAVAYSTRICRAIIRERIPVGRALLRVTSE